MESYDYIIVGAGIAGLSAALSIKRQDPQAKLLLINGETSLPYKRTQLSKKLAQGYQAEEFPLLEFAEYRRKGIHLVQDWITQHHQDRCLLYGSKNRCYRYQRLILATGANYNYPETWQSAFSLSLRDINDGLTIQQHSKASKIISILGAGVEGLELASAYAKTHQLQLFEQQSVPLFRVASVMLQKRILTLLKENHVSFYANTTLKNVKQGSSSALQLETNDAHFASDLLLIATGTSASQALLNGEKNGCDRYLQHTENIFLAGDLCEYQNEAGDFKRCHLWHEAESLGDCAGKNAVFSRFQQPLEVYQTKNYRTKIECFGELFFLAQPMKADREQSEEYEDHGRYYQLWFENGELIGANMYGDTRERAKQLQQLIWEGAAPELVGQTLQLSEKTSIKSSLY